VVRYPGIPCSLWRYTDADLGAQLAPAWRDFARQCGLRLQWHPDEECDEVLGTRGGPRHENSRVYLRGLKTSDSTAPYRKIRGLTLAFVGVDQAEEMPFAYFTELQGRVSAPGYPHQLWITPQPVMKHHWIDQKFPTSNANPDYHYIRTNAYDNVRILGKDYLQKLEEAYPEGSAQRRTLLLGLRGLAVMGDAVYRGYFSRDGHAREVAYRPDLSLYESWDFGHKHPCVSWHQFHPNGLWNILGAVMGRDMFLEDFAPAALGLRAAWFPEPVGVVTTGDPAGEAPSSHGVRITPKDILHAHGSYLQASRNGNNPEARAAAIQAVGSYMRRMAVGGERAFAVSPSRCVELMPDGTSVPSQFTVDGFEAGYVWSELLVRAGGRNLRTPKKDGYYDHFQNTVEYAAQQFSSRSPTQSDVDKFDRKARREAQRDADEDDAPRRRSRGYARR
jgi:hypothetical protein